MRKKIKKVYGYLYAKAAKARYERHFMGDVGLKYLKMGPARGDTLIVVFSSFTRQGVAARYNYVRTLKDIDAPKLFILDDFGLDGRGSYHLGQDGGDEIYRTTRDLIAQAKADAHATNVIYCGSSKGGWVALRCGVADPNGTVIAGSPQYLLGNYAVEEYEKENGNKLLLPYLSSNLNEESQIRWLNGLLKCEIERHASVNPVYLCYSTEEHTYGDHILFLLRDLQAAGRKVSAREESFSNHGDIALYFPEFLHSTIMKMMASE